MGRKVLLFYLLFGREATGGRVRAWGGGCSLAFALRARRGDRRDVLIRFLVFIAVS